jgi:hypothetical protein
MGIDALVAAAADIFGTGAAAAAPEVAAGAVGAGADAAAGTGLADIVGSGAGLFGGTTGLEGTALAAGAGTDLSALAGTGAATAAGTAADFLGAPAASGFGSGAAGAPSLLSGTGAATSGANSALSSILGGSATPTTAGGASVFDTGTGGIPGVSGTGAPSATAAPSAIAPAGNSAASLAGVSPTTPPAVTPPPTAPSGSNIDQLLGKAGTGLANSLTSNPLGVALGAGGLGYSIYEGTQNTKNQQALQADAAAANTNSAGLEAQGQGLVNYLTSGTLPAGYQVQVTQAINSAITNAKSNAAAQGLSTDPTQNTALAAQIAEIQNQEPILQEQLASQLAGTGTSLINAGATAAGLSGSLYSTLVNNDTTQAANAGKAIATLAAALNGKSTNTIGSTTISTG